MTYIFHQKLELVSSQKSSKTHVKGNMFGRSDDSQMHCHTKCCHANQGKVVQPWYRNIDPQKSAIQKIWTFRSLLLSKLFQSSEPLKSQHRIVAWVADVQLTNECMSGKHEIHESFGSRLESFEVFKFIGCFSYDLWAIHKFLVVNATLQPQYTRISGRLHKWENRALTMLPPGPELNPYFYGLHHHKEFLVGW